jgi:hypothetical protein
MLGIPQVRPADDRALASIKGSETETVKGDAAMNFHALSIRKRLLFERRFWELTERGTGGSNKIIKCRAS